MRRFLKVDNEYTAVSEISGILPTGGGAALVLRDGRRIEVNGSPDDIVRALDGEEPSAVRTIPGSPHIW